MKPSKNAQELLKFLSKFINWSDPKPIIIPWEDIVSFASDNPSIDTREALSELRGFGKIQ